MAHFMIVRNILGYDEPNAPIIPQVKEDLSNEYQNFGEFQIEYSGQLLPWSGSISREMLSLVNWWDARV